MPQTATPLGFVSYSHKDEVWLDRLRPSLKVLSNLGKIDFWDDRAIETSAEWFEEIKDKISQARVAILLVSQNFLASEFCIKEEIPFLLEREEYQSLLLIRVLVRPCSWKLVPWLKNRQMTPRDGKTLAEHYDIPHQWETFFADLMEFIAARLEEAPTTAPAFRGSPPPPRAGEGRGGGVAASAVPPAIPVEISRLPGSGRELFGRRAELAALDEAWQSASTHIVSLIAWGGVGKSALVNRWLEGLAKDHWAGAERVFGWSFYSQGSHENSAASADEFIAEALKWFGDKDPAAGSPWDKGERLAELIRQKKTLLILDGLEPLQWFSGDTDMLRDAALATLLTNLAADNTGLVLITSRQKVKDLEGFEATTQSRDLHMISREAGRALLRVRGVRGSDAELEGLSAGFGNHALAVALLAAFIKDLPPAEQLPAARAIPELPRVDPQEQHPRRVIAAFGERFGDGAERQILRLLGLFDRPATAGDLAALTAPPAIPGLTDQLAELVPPPPQPSPARGGGGLTAWLGGLWSKLGKTAAVPSHSGEGVGETFPPPRAGEGQGGGNGRATDTILPALSPALAALRAAGLVAPESAHNPGGLDAHPLVRVHFADELRQRHPEAWRQGNERLYRYLTALPEKHQPDTLAEMAPLYQAIAHGCAAGLQEEARKEILIRRICRGDEYYSVKKLGAFGAYLAALAGLFEQPWSTPVISLDPAARAWLLNTAAYTLRALGRSREATEPQRAAVAMYVEQQNWKQAAIAAGNLSEMLLAAGRVAEAVAAGAEAAAYADRSDDDGERMINRTTHADALHQAGDRAAALGLFEAAEDMQRQRQPQYPRLTSLQGFQYCDLLLALGRHRQVTERAAEALKIAERNRWLLDIALDHLTLGRAHDPGLAGAAGDAARARTHIDAAVEGLRKAGAQHHIPRGLLARAGFRRGQGELDKAHKDLAEARRIADRGGYRLHQIDCDLEEARLLRAEGKPAAEIRPLLARARAAIKQTGYHRRDAELADLEAALA